MTIAKQIKLAIVGATGHVGRETLKALDESELLLVSPILLATAEDSGETLTCQGVDVAVDELTENSFDGVDVALFCVPAAVAKQYIPIAKKFGAVALDVSGTLRTTGVPLTAEGFADTAFVNAKETGLALPHPLAWSLAMVLGKINGNSLIKWAVVSTYQTVSGAGMGAVEEVAAQSIGLLGGGAHDNGFSSDVLAHQAAFNVLPQVGSFVDNGQTTVEQAITQDFQQLTNTKFPLSVGCAYVPTFVGDGMDVTLHFAEGTAPSADDIRGLFTPASGVMVLDDIKQNDYATPYGTAETSYVYLSRVRADATCPDTIKLWIAADHLRVGVARQLVKQTEKVVHQLLG